MDAYKVVRDKEDDGILYGISIVGKPATKLEFITLKEQTNKVQFSENTKKKILCGVVLRPDLPIYREFETGPDKGKPYTIEFGAQEVEAFCHDFMKNNYLKSTSFDHNDNKWLDDTCVVENWIVEDPNNDKANALGITDLVKGDWVSMMQLSDKSWSEYIETGLAKGFSIDSFVKFDKIQFRNTMKNEKKSLLSQLVSLFEQNKTSEVNFMDVQTDKGLFTVESLEMGKEVMKNLELFINDEFTYEGKVYKTDELGKIVEISDVQEEMGDGEGETTPVLATEIPTGEKSEADKVAGDIQNELTNTLEDVDVDKLKEKVKILQDLVDSLTKEKEALLATNMSLDAEVTNLKTVEATTKLGATPYEPKTSRGRLALALKSK